MVDVLSGFMELFQGREDAFGDEEGSCIRVDPLSDPWPSFARGHLNGDRPIGVYPMVRATSGHIVRWGCVDFDEGESASWIHALNLHRVLEALGVTGWMERSRSKGYHVWVFSSDWVDAPIMRRALLGATQIAQAPLKEINPKSEQLGYTKTGLEQVGNYVRLPYPKVADFTPRRVVVGRDGEPMSLYRFIEAALESRTNAQHLAGLEKYWEPPARPKPEVGPALNVSATDVIPGELPDAYFMGKTANAVFRYGPFDGRDRSSALWKLAVCLREDGYKASETLAFVMDADSRWGKHIERGDVIALERMVTKAYER